MICGEGFRFGDWVVHSKLNQIQRAGETQHLEPNVMDVLLYLAQHPGRVLNKGEILDAVWPDTFVIEDALIRTIVEQCANPSAITPSLHPLSRRFPNVVIECSPRSLPRTLKPCPSLSCLWKT